MSKNIIDICKKDIMIQIFTFFYIHKKKPLDLWIFTTSGIRWINMFWDVMNTIWPSLENVCLSVDLSVCMSPKFCGYCISRTKARKLMKHYIQLHLDTIQCWLHLGAYRSRSSDVFKILIFFNTVVQDKIARNCT